LQAVARRHRPSLTRYAERRMGHGSQWSQIANLVVRPFGAATFAGFWRTFNPLYSYVLHYYCYRPLRRLMPRRAAELVTFGVSGFALHEVPLWAIRGEIGLPWVTAWFGLAGAIAVAADVARVDIGDLPFAARAAMNLSYLLGTMLVVVLIAQAA
jgi:hypothetical protein